MNTCADCGGIDFEWMHICPTHKLEFCRGCECPACAEYADLDDLYDFSEDDDL